MPLVRNLQYKDRWVWYPTQDLAGVPTEDWQPIVLTDEDTYVLVRTNRNDFKEILSSLQTGADLSYPEKAHQIVFNFLREYEYPMSICSMIIDCIENDADVKTALLEFLRDDVPQDSGDTGTGTQLPESTLSQSMIGGCNNDNLYAATTQLVDFVHAGIVDFLEIVEANTGRLERMNVVVSAIPIVGILPIDEALLFLDQIIENFMNNYAAQYTQTLRDEYACELFCIAQNNCELTFKDMADYFSAKAGATFDAITLGDALDWFIFGTWNGDLIVHGMHALFCWAIVWGSEFFGVNLNRIVRVVQAAYNDSDPDWEIECDDCSPDNPLNPCIQWNDLAGNGWTITLVNIGTVEEPASIDNAFGNGAPSAKAGFVTSSGLHGRDLSVVITFDTPQICHSAAMQYWFNDAGNNALRRRIAFIGIDGVAHTFTDTSANDATKSAWTDFAWSGGDVENVYAIRFLIQHLGSNTAIYNAEDTSAWLDNICVDVEPMTFDNFVPIVVWENSFCEDGFGTTITDLGGGYWRLSSVANPNNAAALGVSFKDVLGRAFNIDDINFTSSTGMYYGGAHAGASCRQETYNWFTSPPVDLLQCDFQRGTGEGSFDVTFHAVLA